MANDDEEIVQSVVPDGLTLRDYFASAAMQAMLGLDKKGKAQARNLALASYLMAEAMLAERQIKRPYDPQIP
jgi:hypothetical protein